MARIERSIYNILKKVKQDMEIRPGKEAELTAEKEVKLQQEAGNGPKSEEELEFDRELERMMAPDPEEGKGKKKKKKILPSLILATAGVWMKW